MLKGLLWILTAVALVFAIIALLPYIADRVPWSVEERAFTAMSPLIPEKECDGHPAANAILQQVLARIYPIYPSDKDFPVHVAVIRGKEINAFAFLAGRIYVYNGLLQQADSPDELAAVLAHEIEHVKERHVIQGLIQKFLGYYLWQTVFPDTTLGHITNLLAAADHLKFSRIEEHEADQGALDRLRDAHVSALGFRRFFSRGLGTPEPMTVFSDHPSDESRAHLADAFLKYPSRPVITDAQWKALKEICRH